MDLILEIIASFFVLVGSLFMLISAIGIIRLPDFYIRISAVTKAGTLGVGFIMLGIALHFNELSILIKSFSIIIFILFTSPASAHIIGLAAARSKVRFWEKTNLMEFKDYLEKSNKLSKPTERQEKKD